MATLTREVEIEFDEEDAVAHLHGATLVNAIINNDGLDTVLDEISNDDIRDYLRQFDEQHVFGTDDEFHDAAVGTVLSDAGLLERVLRAVPVPTLAVVLENMGGTV